MTLHHHALGEVIELAYGASLPKRARREGTVPVYGSNGPTGWHDAALVPDNTIIVGRKGSAGAVHFVEGPSYPIDTTYFVRPRPGCEIELRYLYHALIRLDLGRLAVSTGVPGLNREDAYRERIPLPPLDEQRRIVDLLSRAAGLKRLAQEAQAKARELIPALFVDMFGDPAVNPKVWPTFELKELVRFASGGTPSKGEPAFWDGAIPWVSAKDMKADLLTTSQDSLTDAAIVRGGAKLVPAGSCVVVVRGMILAHTVPIRQTSVPLVINQDLKALIPSDRIDGCYLRWALQCLHQHLLSRVTTAGHGTKKLDLDELTGLQMPLPPSALQQAFAERAREVTSIQRLSEQAAAAAERTSAALMSRLFAA